MVRAVDSCHLRRCACLHEHSPGLGIPSDLLTNRPRLPHAFRSEWALIRQSSAGGITMCLGFFRQSYSSDTVQPLAHSVYVIPHPKMDRPHQTGRVRQAPTLALPVGGTIGEIVPDASPTEISVPFLLRNSKLASKLPKDQLDTRVPNIHWIASLAWNLHRIRRGVYSVTLITNLPAVFPPVKSICACLAPSALKGYSLWTVCFRIPLSIRRNTLLE